jgi:hypothetical protein
MPEPVTCTVRVTKLTGTGFGMFGDGRALGDALGLADGLAAAVTVSDLAGDVPPFGSGFWTVTLCDAGAVRNEAGTVIVNSAALA